MIDKRSRKRGRLSREILSLIGISAFVSLILFLVVSTLANGVAETYCFDHDIVMTEFDWIELNRWIFGVSAFLACCTFSILFLSMLGDRIAYIRKITEGIDALHTPDQSLSIPLEGNNELTELASAINDMSSAQRQIREKEQALAREKEQVIRALSHDIRTPLTSILAYSDYLTTQEEITPKEQKSYMLLIRKKAEQIRDLTDVLLDGSRRNPERFEDGRLLLEQIIAEFGEELEDRFEVRCDLSGCPSFAGCFDVQELRRIFDNLSSNIQKYADPDKPVTLTIRIQNGALLIRQTNAALSQKPQSESYRIGLNSIRRIAQAYGGQVSVEQSRDQFAISITLAEI